MSPVDQVDVDVVQLAALRAERDPSRCGICERPSAAVLCAPCARVLRSEHVPTPAARRRASSGGAL